MENTIKSLPMVALRGMTIMPEMVVHFDVSRERSVAAIQEAMAEKQKIRHASISKMEMGSTESCHRKYVHLM